MNSVERWGMFEAEIRGPEGGNPFLEHNIQGIFTQQQEEI